MLVRHSATQMDLYFTLPRQCPILQYRRTCRAQLQLYPSITWQTSTPPCGGIRTSHRTSTAYQSATRMDMLQMALIHSTIWMDSHQRRPIPQHEWTPLIHYAHRLSIPLRRDLHITLPQRHSSLYYGWTCFTWPQQYSSITPVRHSFHNMDAFHFSLCQFGNVSGILVSLQSHLSITPIEQLFCNTDGFTLSIATTALHSATEMDRPRITTAAPT